MNVLIEHIHTSIDMICTVVSVIVTIITVALPLSLNNVAEQLNVYRSKRIRNMFVAEPTYKAMLGSIVLLAASILFALLFKQEQSGEVTVLSVALGFFCFLYALVSIVIFFFFIRRVNDYSVNTEEVVLKKYVDSFNKLSYKEPTYKEQAELIDGIANVISQQIKKRNYSDAFETSKTLANFVIKFFESVKSDDPQGISIIQSISKKYYDAVFEHWRDCYRNSSETASKIIETYNKVVAKTLNDERVNYDQNPYFPLFLLYQRIAANLDESDKKEPYSSLYPWHWYFEILYGTEIGFNASNIFFLNAYALSSLKQDIDNDLDFVITSMVGHIIDSNYSWKYTSYPRFGDNEIDHAIEKIQEDAGLCFMPGELVSIIDNLNNLKIDEAENARIKELVENQFKYNNIQFVTLVLCAYCLEKGKYDLLRKILEYNQPRSSEARFCNKDIIPDTLQEVIEYYDRSSLLLIKYSVIWDNHFDISGAFKYFLGLLACWVSQKNIIGNNLLIRVPVGNKKALQKLSIVLEYLKNLVEKQEKEVLGFLNMSVDVKTNVIRYIEEKLLEVSKQIEACSESETLDDLKVATFTDTIVEYVKKNPIWKNLLDQTSLSEDGEEKSYDIIINGEQKKSFLATGDDGIFVGFPQGFSIPVIDEIDSKIERSLIAQSRLHPFEEFRVSESDFKEKLYQFSADVIVIFINYHSVYEMFINDNTFNWSRGDYPKIGKIENGALICSVGDSHFSGARMIVIDKKDFSPVDIGIAKDKITVLDLNEHNEKLEELVQGGLYSKDFPKEDELRHYLRRCVRVEIKFKFSFRMNPTAKVLYLPLKNKQ